MNWSTLKGKILIPFGAKLFFPSVNGSTLKGKTLIPLEQSLFFPSENGTTLQDIDSIWSKVFSFLLKMDLL